MTLPTRKVQRLKKDEAGNLIPIPEEKKLKNKMAKKKLKTDAKQVFSLMDPQSGEMVTFEVPNINNSIATILNINNQSYNQDVSVTVPYNDILNDKIPDQTNIAAQNSNILLNTDIGNLNIVDQNFTNNLLSAVPISENQSNYSNILQEAIENSRTCDILLPENNLENSIQQNSENYLQNPYHYL